LAGKNEASGGDYVRRKKMGGRERVVGKKYHKNQAKNNFSLSLASQPLRRFIEGKSPNRGPKDRG